ncbi:molybdopterin molybdotransferase MoeA [Alkalicoccobacillus plakortidis]|uniref:Molybdopterin molybdenumtransferase n=1 Tax=Alkalicoccobacillus plakortidis TaxID=444060 RepID=A0ABT0XGB8_9BACI|nr:gephyrin-like molybdotransferase Glp [Alkalicoccobacillus plakortidis]MCM2674945.1 molybdopterin molybdotransferase MoeA [Alkalicoccobacillus plakortidis]
MLEKRTPIPVSEAVKKVMSIPQKQKTEQVHLHKAYRRTLAEDLIAKHPVPPFDRSPYDGFAIRSQDSSEASRDNPITFQVIETIGAGSVCSREVQSGEAVRIMTGAMLPKNCDAIVMLELAHAFSENETNYMTIKREFPAGHNISYQGEDVATGTILLKKGTVINPGTAALLATFGYEYVTVAKQPTIGVFATGSELLDLGDPLEPGKIRNSNTHMLLAQIERAGAIPYYMGNLPDEFDLCYNRVKEAAEQVDMLITTGGVSVGDFDLLPEVYAKLEAEVLFNKIAMRPGSVTTVAVWQDTLLFGLSGNPSACYVGFEVFVKPVIGTSMLQTKPHLQKVKATLIEPVPKANPFTRFVRCALSYSNDQLQVAPSGFNKSSAVSSLAKTVAFMVLPGGTRGYTTGDLVDVLLLESSEGSEWPWE